MFACPAIDDFFRARIDQMIDLLSGTFFCAWKKVRFLDGRGGRWCVEGSDSGQLAVRLRGWPRLGRYKPPCSS